ncbi:OmpA family protein [Vibrio sp. 10N.286.51.E5]|uniref:OmpA family protein n=1 Tax=Vibrio sp. 10N.286.51.E5 TaxID=3229709 RepID=UPI00354D986A
MNRKLAFLGTVLIAGNSLAMAQDNPWYVGGRIGVTHYSDFDGVVSSSQLKDDDDFGGGVFLGYSFNDWFGLEGGYTYLGELQVTDQASIKTNVIDFVGKFTWQATDSFDVFLKAGGYGYQTKGRDGLSGLKDTDIDGTVGIGIEQRFTDNFSARLEYQYYNNATLDDGGFDSNWDTNLFALGLVYSWGGTKAAAVTEAPMIQEEEVVVEEEPVVVEEVVEKSMVQVEPAKVEVYFDFDKEHLTQKSTDQLQPIIDHLQEHPESTVVLVGHADSSGPSELNQKLSEKRAETVANYLTTEYSISEDRITTSGEGESTPIATNDTEEGRAKNRRVSVFSPSFTMEEK